MIWNHPFSQNSLKELITIDINSDEVSSDLALDCPVRPFVSVFNYNNLSILAVCKNIYNEVKPIFWSKTTFVFQCTRDLIHFINQRTIVLGPRALTNLENVQHVHLSNDDLSNTYHLFRGRVLARLAKGASIVSLFHAAWRRIPLLVREMLR
jgi:hypothetical protein